VIDKGGFGITSAGFVTVAGRVTAKAGSKPGIVAVETMFLSVVMNCVRSAPAGTSVFTSKVKS
jgi:hypothetical protein